MENWQYPQPITIELVLIFVSSSIFVIIPGILKEEKEYAFLELRAKVQKKEVLSIWFLFLDSVWKFPF